MQFRSIVPLLNKGWKGGKAFVITTLAVSPDFNL